MGVLPDPAYVPPECLTQVDPMVFAGNRDAVTGEIGTTVNGTGDDGQGWVSQGLRGRPRIY